MYTEQQQKIQFITTIKLDGADAMGRHHDQSLCFR